MEVREAKCLETGRGMPRWAILWAGDDGSDAMQSKPKRISERQLGRNPGEILRAVKEGETVVVEKQGQPDVAMIDLVDLEILKGVIGYYLHSSRIEPDATFSAAELEELEGQALFDRVLSHYLASTISLGRAAEALDIPWVELRSRLARLGVPVWTGPTDAEGIRQDALVAESITC